jgi:integrase
MYYKLTKLRVDRIRTPGRYGDGGGLWLQVSENGGKSWLLRYTRHGRHRHMGLGPVDVVSLAEARDRAREARRQLLDGIDPIEQRNRQRAEQRLAGMTFRTAAEAVIADREGKWRSASHRGQWRATLERHVYPVIGNLPVAEIDTQHVLRCIKPIWDGKQVTADRIRQRIEAVLNWATAHGYRKLRDNPARWRGHLQHLLTDTAKTKHLAAMPWADVPRFISALRTRVGVAPRALEFTILTACRTGEVLGTTWDEIDGDTWTIPASRTKTNTAHRVPLSPRATEILEALPREGDFIFIGARAHRPLNRHAMKELLELMGLPFTVHGFRSTFRDWASESTGYEHAVCEAALAHSIPGTVERAYRRGDLFDKRKRLMSEWASFCGQRPRAAAGDVVPLRKAEPQNE